MAQQVQGTTNCNSRGRVFDICLGACVGLATAGIFHFFKQRRLQHGPTEVDHFPKWADHYVERILFTEQEIQAGIDSLAQRLNVDYEGRKPLVIGVLNGAFVILADLTRRFDFEHDIDFIRAASYGLGGTTSADTVKLTVKMKFDVRGRDIIILDELVETGKTLKAIVELIKSMGAASVKTACLVNKRCRVVDLKIDYVALEAPDEWLFGFGMDSKERFRSLPFIAVASDEAKRGNWDGLFRKELVEK